MNLSMNVFRTDFSKHPAPWWVVDIAPTYFIGSYMIIFWNKIQDNVQMEFSMKTWCWRKVTKSPI